MSWVEVIHSFSVNTRYYLLKPSFLLFFLPFAGNTFPCFHSAYRTLFYSLFIFCFSQYSYYAVLYPTVKIASFSQWIQNCLSLYSLRFKDKILQKFSKFGQKKVPERPVQQSYPLVWLSGSCLLLLGGSRGSTRASVYLTAPQLSLHINQACLQMSRWLSSLQMVRAAAAAGLPRSQLFPSPRHGVGQGAETFTCHHAAGRSGTSIRSNRLSLYSFTSLSSCSAAPLNPPNLCVSDTETLIRPWGGGGGGGSLQTLLSGKATLYLECKEIHFPLGEIVKSSWAGVEVGVLCRYELHARYHWIKRSRSSLVPWNSAVCLSIGNQVLGSWHKWYLESYVFKKGLLLNHLRKGALMPHLTYSNMPFNTN